MNEEERRLLTEVKNMIRLFLITFTVMVTCFTIIVAVVSISWAVTTRGMSNDYFYSDYETVPSIEQSVDVRSGE